MTYEKAVTIPKFATVSKVVITCDYWL